jgi:hypothetical protein
MDPSVQGRAKKMVSWQGKEIMFNVFSTLTKSLPRFPI